LRTRLYIVATLFVFLFTGILRAQDNSNDNLPSYYKHRLHFGFTIGFNKADFIIHPVKNLVGLDSLKSVRSIPDYGFNLGIVSEFAFHQYLTLRFVPDLSFAARTLEYYFDTPKDSTRGIVGLKKVVESTFVDFPLDIKLRSKRLHNFAAYVLGGGRYSIDLASQKDVNNASQATAVVKLRKDDYGMNVGAGMDFFLPYFKFGLELKYIYGFKDLIVHDNIIYSNAIEKLNSKIVLISLTFEG
jgi:hypothetical protein